MNNEVIAQNEACRITLCSDEFNFFTDFKHEVHDKERGKVLSQWKDSQKLLSRLEEVDHRLTEEFRDWYQSQNE